LLVVAILPCFELFTYVVLCTPYLSQTVDLADSG